MSCGLEEGSEKSKGKRQKAKGKSDLDGFAVFESSRPAQPGLGAPAASRPARRSLWSRLGYDRAALIFGHTERSPDWWARLLQSEEFCR